MSKFFTPEEVSYHNCSDDCWVSVFDTIFDLSDLIKANNGPLAMPLIQAAGTSISHWFRIVQTVGPAREGSKIITEYDVKMHMDPERNIMLPYTPYGRFLHVLPPEPTDMTPSCELPWWKDKKYMIGKLTKKIRIVKVANMLTRTEDVINTCEEETINDIRDRYMEFNQHGQSYTWKALLDGEFVTLDMSKTLEENGVVDETEKFSGLGLDEDFYVPTLHIYFNDDLTYA